MSEKEINQNRVSNDNDTESETPVIPELDQFIFKPDEFTQEIVPRELVHKDVARYLIDKIKESDKLKTFIQVEKVAVFYDTYEITEKYRTFLNRNEKSEGDVLKSIVIARILAKVGSQSDREYAVKYYEYLITKADSLEEFEALIELHESLDLGINSGKLKSKINEKLKSLEEKKDSSYEARLDYLAFQEKINLKLNRAEKVQNTKDKILAISDHEKRTQEEIKAYLGIEYGFPEILQSWAAARIRRETWSSNIREQTKRNDELPLKAVVIKAFRDVLIKLKDFPNVSEKRMEGAKIRILRAIKFFGGELSEEEESFLTAFKGMQGDILANEGYLLTKEGIT